MYRLKRNQKRYKFLINLIFIFNEPYFKYYNFIIVLNNRNISMEQQKSIVL